MPSSCRNLLDLPYDIRHLIYQELFPKTAEIYLQAFGKILLVNIPDRTVPLEILRVNRQFNSEAGDFFYGNYLFTIYGMKKDCLVAFPSFCRTLAKYARQKPRVDVFSNGTHSSTAGISIQAGDNKLPILSRRRRGQHKTIQDLELECRQSSQQKPPWMLLAFVVALLSWLVLFLPDTKALLYLRQRYCDFMSILQ